MSAPAPTLSAFSAPASGQVRLRRRPDQILGLAVLISLAFHAILLTVHFRFPDALGPRRADQNLEVTLVNARHTKAPEDADALAQANLEGGGEVEGKTRPSTPLPPQDRRREGDALQEARKRAVVADTKAQQVLTRPAAAASLRSESRPNDLPAEAPRQLSGYDLLDSAAAMVRMDASIDKSLNEMAQRPRRAIVGARTQEYRFARYVEDWRQKIERIGTLNYPDSARGRIYGSLVLSVSIKSDGSVDRVEINRSSGHKVLDEAAQRIVLLAAPFAAFPPDIRRDTDVIEIVRTWTFTQGDQIQTAR
ncbi:MAG: energy transducer TonB [Zoogloeaceae bacterium]|nr:energy transducer TonB [Zoogloeaceae bacterium]